MCIWEHIKNIIDTHKTDSDPAWQQELHKLYSTFLSTIPIVQGVYKGNTDAEVEEEKKALDLKSPTINEWQQFGTKRSGIVTSGDKIGAACGPASDLLVLDVDDLDFFMNQFCPTHGIPLKIETLTVMTRQNRYQFYFKYPNDGKTYGNRGHGKIGTDAYCGFDVRGLGGYIILAGSVHPVTKTFYEIVNPIPPAPAPDWLKNWSLFRSVTEPQQETPSSGVQVSVPIELTSTETIADAIKRLPINIQQLLNTNVPVGQRSDHVMSAVDSMLLKLLTPEQIQQILLNVPLGDVVREKGLSWLNGTIASGQAFTAPILAAKTTKKQKLYMSQELFQTMMEFEYFLNRDSMIYYAKMTADDGHTVFYDIASEMYEGKILRRQEEKTTISGTINDLKQAKKKLMSYVAEHARPIMTLARFGKIDGKIYWNLARESGECLCISTDGCALVAKPMAVIPEFGQIEPIQNLNLGCFGLSMTQKMLDLLGIKDNAERHFFTILLISYLFPDYDSPILYLVDDHGRGKTTLAAALKWVFDPVEEKQRGGLNLPERKIELALELSQQGVLHIDNFSGLSKAMQNTLCQAFSDGYVSIKKHYSNGQLMKIPLSCNIILTSLELPLNLRSDLASRTVFYKLPDRTSFMADTDFWEEYNKLLPSVRGELCHLASQMLTSAGMFKATGLNRWGDFDKLGQAFFKSLGANDPEAEYIDLLKPILRKNSKILSKNEATIEELVKFVSEYEILVFTMEEMQKKLWERCYGYVSGNSAALGKYVKAHQNMLADLGVAVIEGGKLDYGRIYLAATETKLKSLGGEQAVEHLKKKSTIIKNLHGKPQEEIEQQLEAFFKNSNEDTTEEEDVE